MSKKIFIPFICWLVISLLSCKKNFIELNTNPNISQLALPQNLLAPALTELVKTNILLSQDIGSEFTQVHMQTVSRTYSTFRFDINPALSTEPYSDLYLTLVNFRDMYNSGAKAFELNNAQTYNKTYMGIALVCEVLNASLITDMFGDVPYFEAGKAKELIFLPKFDQQKEIYLDLFKKLEEANSLLIPNVNLPSDQVSYDPLFAGSALRWRKFGNSLYLRLLLRASNKPEANAQAKIKEIVQTNSATYPIIATNAESAILRFSNTIPYINPLSLIVEGMYGQVRYTEFFINNLNDWGDPRVTKWANLSNGVYAGMPGGYATNENPVNRSGRLTSLKTEPLMGNLLNYSEVQFILAEASVRGWITDNAKTYYETGTTSHIALWGLAVPANYLAGQKVRWDDNLNLDTKLEKILLQRYYSLFYTDLQQWFEYNRTGHPVLPLTGAGFLNNKKVPVRLIYPVYLQATNGANLAAAIANQGADDINTKMWWQRS